jgi:hypothetical protein
MAAHGDDEVDGEEMRGTEAEVPGGGAGGGDPAPAGAGPATAVSVTPEEERAPQGDERRVPAAEHTATEGETPVGAEDEEPEASTGMTPRQARRVRAVVSGVVMAVVAVALLLRLGSAPSLLTVGGYGLALILSGTAIVLSRRGRTRVATAVLACGFVTIILAERALAGT